MQMVSLVVQAEVAGLGGGLGLEVLERPVKELEVETRSLEMQLTTVAAVVVLDQQVEITQE